MCKRFFRSGSENDKFFLACVLLAGLAYIQAFSQSYIPAAEIETVEVSAYPIKETPQRIYLEVPYAKADFHEPQKYPVSQSKWVRGVDLVFTKYPADFTRWLTDYDWLLNKRLANLAALDTSLLTRTDIRWRFILQTQCETEPEAMSMFHGFVIHIRPGKEEVPEVVEEPMVAVTPELPKPGEKVNQLIEEEPDMEALAEIVYGETPLTDSTFYDVLARHHDWNNMLVVMDWTASMYENGASTMRWFRDQLPKKRIKHLVLFNDGNNKHFTRKLIGRTGGIYHARPDSIDEVLLTMLKVKKAGLGGDAPENDMEALLVGTTKLRGYREVILIPDAGTSIRDIQLLTKLKVPVKILLFRPDKRVASSREFFQRKRGRYIHPHYLTLASITKGSIHTDKSDINHLYKMEAGQIFRSGQYEYRKRENGSFELIR
ncbi:MAG: hypothetical protein AAF655_10455 [Bacteroidota bacterium]